LFDPGVRHRKCETARRPSPAKPNTRVRATYHGRPRRAAGTLNRVYGRPARIATERARGRDADRPAVRVRCSVARPTPRRRNDRFPGAISRIRPKVRARARTHVIYRFSVVIFRRDAAGVCRTMAAVWTSGRARPPRGDPADDDRYIGVRSHCGLPDPGLREKVSAARP